MFFQTLFQIKDFVSIFNLGTKYDLPLDFYIKCSLVYNFDNKPKGGTPKNNYVFWTTGESKLELLRSLLI